MRFVLVLLLAARPALSQFNSAIQGIVTDAARAVTPGARILVTNLATGT